MNNDSRHIDTLLEMYWEGDTSLAQEAELKAYFNGANVTAEHEVYTPMFKYFTNQRELTTNIDVETLINNLDEQKETRPSIFKLFSIRKYSMGIAAAFTLMLSVVTVMNLQTITNDSSQTIVLDEDAETQEALRITREALALLSNKIDKSSQRVNQGVAKMKSASILR